MAYDSTETHRLYTEARERARAEGANAEDQIRAGAIAATEYAATEGRDGLPVETIVARELANEARLRAIAATPKAPPVRAAAPPRPRRYEDLGGPDAIARAREAGTLTETDYLALRADYIARKANAKRN